MTDEERQQLLKEYQPLAWKRASRFRGLGVPLDDLRQEAWIGIWEASLTFDPDGHPGVPFSAYASPYVLRRLTRAVTAATPGVSQVHGVRRVCRELQLDFDVLDRCGPGRHVDDLADEIDDAMHVALDEGEQSLLLARYWRHADLFTLSRETGLPVRSLSRRLAIARGKLGDELCRRGLTCAKPAPVQSIKMA